jgi:hypothetical protein
MFYDTEISVSVVTYSSNVYSSIKITIFKKKGKGIGINKMPRDI